MTDIDEMNLILPEWSLDKLKNKILFESEIAILRCMALYSIDQLKECREENLGLNNLFDIQQTRMKKAVRMWRKDTGKKDTIPDLGDLLDYFLMIVKDLEQWKKDVLRAADDYDKQIEQRTKEACKKALYSKVMTAPVSDFQYAAWRDIEKAIDEAKVE